MALRLTQPLTEMSTRSIFWGKGGRCVRLTTYHHPVPLSRNVGTLISWNPLGPSGPIMGLLYLLTTSYDTTFTRPSTPSIPTLQAIRILSYVHNLHIIRHPQTEGISASSRYGPNENCIQLVFHL